MYDMLVPLEGNNYLPNTSWNCPYPSTRWWFPIFFIFIPIWGSDPFWLIFLRWVEITNQFNHRFKTAALVSLAVRHLGSGSFASVWELQLRRVGHGNCLLDVIYGQKICRAHLPAVFFQETRAIITHLMFFLFLGELGIIRAILTFSAHEIRRVVFLRQIFGPCATAGGLETFPTRGCCRGGFLRCGATRHGGSWGAPLPWAWPPICKLAMAGQHHQQWLKEKVPGERGCVILRGLFHHDMGIRLSSTHFWGVNWLAKMMCHLLFRKSWCQ